MLYNNIESTVINNGNTGYYLKLERGVRQGCPLSAYLFILAIEVLANKIRFEKNIKGININNKIIKLSILADDLTLILTNLVSFENALKLLNKFSQCSGLKINTNKTKRKKYRNLRITRTLPSWAVLDQNIHRNTWNRYN